jgi:hypothetical protein
MQMEFLSIPSFRTTAFDVWRVANPAEAFG